MPIHEKPANLSPELLTPKDIPSLVGTEPTSADRPDAAGDRRPIDATAELKAQAAMLSPKGAASAAGFRPHYWSYDHAEAPSPSAPTAVVSLFPDTPPRSAAPPPAQPATPLPAESAEPPVADSATSAPTATPQPVPSRASPLVIVFGCIAVIVSGSLYWLAPSRPTTVPLRTAAVAPPAEAAAPAPVRHDEPTPPRAVAPHPEAAAPSNTVRVVEAPPPSAAAGTPSTVVAPADLVAAKAAAPAAVVSSGEAAVSAFLREEVGNLLARGDQLLASDDIAASRLLYQRAAELGSGPAATAVGKTFDPLFLEQARARGIRGDAAIAAGWYRKASAAGDRQGQIRLELLLARFPE
jgi:hypothetical protein